MKTAIIVPTHKRPAMLKRLLIDLGPHSLPPDVDVYVIENGPRCGVEGICRADFTHDRVRYLYLAEGRKSHALNHGMKVSGADFFIFFDDDIRPSGNIVEIYLEAARRRGPGHFFGGPLIADAEAPCPSDLLPYLPLSAKGWLPSDHEMEMEISSFDYFFGANWAAFQPDLEKSGLFSEQLGITASIYSPVGEENEIQRRLIATSTRPVFLPGAAIHHPVPRECYTLRWVWRRRFRLGRTNWTLTEAAEQKHCRSIFGVPLWIIRALAGQTVKAALSDLSALPRERRTESRMRQAYLAGLACGAWTARGG